MNKPKVKFYQHLRAPQSPMGNPQRLFIIIDEEGGIINIVDEGYRGLPQEYSKLRQLPTIEISRSAYHEWKREAVAMVES